MNSIKNKQRGASFLGILFVGGALVFLGIIAAQLLPTYVEYMAIAKAVEKVKNSTNAAEARRDFDKAAQIDDIKSISGKDLVITKEGEKTVVTYAYTKEIRLVGPAYLLMKYAGRSN